ncbi:hypothetical protein [Dyella japonica]|nr:hypothetical protein [Dyella japonica]
MKRLEGITAGQALAEVRAVPDPDARAAGAAILWFVYEANRDSHLTPNQVAAQMRADCLSTSTAQQ